MTKEEFVCDFLDYRNLILDPNLPADNQNIDDLEEEREPNEDGDWFDQTGDRQDDNPNENE